MRFAFAIIALILLSPVSKAGVQVRIEVHADRPIGDVHRYMTGAFSKT